MLEFERMAAGLALALAARHEQRSLGDYFGLPAYLQVGLLMHHVIAQGRELYTQAWSDATVLEREAQAMTEASGLWLWAVFRPESMNHHAYACKLVAQWVADGWTSLLPGMSLLSPFFRTQFPEREPNTAYQVSRDVDDGAVHMAFGASGGQA